MLVFHLKKEWFDLIKQGKKTHEFRVVNEYWETRISNYLNSFFSEEDFEEGVKVFYENIPIKFVLGYTKKFLNAKLISINKINGKNTDLKIDREVFDLEFKLMEENK